MEKYYSIVKYMAETLFKNGVLDEQNHQLRCKNTVHELARIPDENKYLTYNTSLFEAIKNIYPNVEIRDILIIIDFDKCDKAEINLVTDIENGIVFIDKLGHETIYKLFISSNSMARHNQCYFVNEKYEQVLTDVVNMGFRRNGCNNKMVVSKYHAYSGLWCTNATILDGITLKADEVAVIQDYELHQKDNCLTAISKTSIYESLNSLKNTFESILDNFSDTLACELTTKGKSGILKRRIREINTNEEVVDCMIKAIERKQETNAYKNKLPSKVKKENYSKLEKETDESLLIVLKEVQQLYKLPVKDIPNELDNIINSMNYSIEDEIFWSPLYLENCPITINAFDGVGLISKDFAEEINKKLDDKASLVHNSFQIRLPYVKGVVHSCDFREFFHNHDKTTIKCMKNFKTNNEKEYFEEKPIDKVKIILSESQFKAAKYLKDISKEVLKEANCNSQFEYYFHELNKRGCNLGIANFETQEIDERQLNFQFLLTLPLSDELKDYLLEKGEKKLYSVSSSDYIINNLSDSDDDKLDRYLSQNYLDSYLKTQRLKDKRKNAFATCKQLLQIGKLFCPSYRRFLSPDLLLFLYVAAGKKIDKNKYIDPKTFYAPLTDLEKKDGINHDGEKSIILRNPHYSRNEIITLKRAINKDDERSKYFSHLYGTAMVDAKTCVADRLGGADYDGDSVLIVNDQTIAEYVMDNIVEEKADKFIYKYSLVKIPSLMESPKELTYKNRSQSIVRTFSNKIGAISNDAFGVAIHAYQGDERYDSLLANYTLLSGLEIDSVKTGSHPKLIKYNCGKSTSEEQLFIKLKDSIVDNTYKKKDFNDNLKKYKDVHILYRIAYEISNLRVNQKGIKEDKPLELKQLFKPRIHLVNKEYIERVELLNTNIKFINTSIGSYNGHKKDMNMQILSAKNSIIKMIGNYDFEDYISMFKTENPRVTLSRYLKCYYHLLTDDYSKDKVLNYLELDLPDDIKTLVKNFDNDNYRLLFLSLLYWKYFYSLHNFNIEDKLNDENKDEYKMVQDCSEDFMAVNYKMTKVADIISNYIKTNFNDIPFDYFLNGLDSNYIFSYLPDEMINWLEEGKGDING